MERKFRRLRSSKQFKVPFEQSENIERSRVKKVYGQIFQWVENPPSLSFRLSHP